MQFYNKDFRKKKSFLFHFLFVLIQKHNLYKQCIMSKSKCILMNSLLWERVLYMTERPRYVTEFKNRADRSCSS